jgi:hypothetical protein
MGSAQEGNDVWAIGAAARTSHSTAGVSEGDHTKNEPVGGGSHGLDGRVRDPSYLGFGLGAPAGAKEWREVQVTFITEGLAEKVRD